MKDESEELEWFIYQEPLSYSVKRYQETRKLSDYEGTTDSQDETSSSSAGSPSPVRFSLAQNG